MASAITSCGVCDLRHISTPSVVWCHECGEGLCSECEKHHALSKASRTHNTIPISVYNSLPANILAVTNFCCQHQEKFQIFCKKHDCPCCSKCVVESHTQCVDIEHLDNVVKDIKTSNAFQQIEEMLNEAVENIRRITKNRQENTTSISNDKDKIESEIMRARKEIDKYLDKIQKELISDLNTKAEKEQNIISDQLKLLKQHEDEIISSKKLLSNIKTHASDLQTFLALKQLDVSAAGHETFIDSFLMCDNLKATSLSLNMCASIQKFASEVKRFGDVTVNTAGCKIDVSKKIQLQAQMVVVDRNIDNMKLELQKAINTKSKTSIYGCSLTPGGKVIFSLYDQRAISVNNTDGSEDFLLPINESPKDVAYIPETKTIAVSSEGRKCLLIDIDSKEIKRSIPVRSRIDGIAIQNNELLFCAENIGIRMINLVDESIRDIIRKQLPILSYIAVFQDKVYYSANEEHTVVCSDRKGTLLWTFKDETILRKPRGVCVDNNGKCYVAGNLSGNIIVISKDGKHHRELLSSNDGIGRPSALHCDRTNNKLVVTNATGDVYLYNISSS